MSLPEGSRYYFASRSPSFLSSQTLHLLEKMYFCQAQHQLREILKLMSSIIKDIKGKESNFHPAFQAISKTTQHSPPVRATTTEAFTRKHYNL